MGEENESNTEVVADAAKAEAQASHELAKALNERLDLLHQDMGSNFGRVHERLDGVERTLASKADIEVQAEKGKEVAEEPVQAAELVVEPATDVVVKKEEKAKRGKKGRRKR